MKLNDLVRKRKSPVIFSDQPIERQKISLLFEAARWAPSSMNEQPWRFVFATNENSDDFNRLFDTLAKGNKEWVKNVPLLILTIAKTNFEYKNKPNKHAFYDVASAVANLTFQANDMDLWVHQMGGFSTDQVKQNLKIPPGFEPITMLAVGYLGDVKNAPENLRKRELAERKRNSQEKFVFYGRWN